MQGVSAVARGSGRLASVAAPWRGWNTRDPLASMQEGFAPIFDNYIVEGGEPRVRLGFAEWATGLGGRVDGVFNFAGAGVAEKLFASSGSSIFDVTTAGAVGAAVVTGLTSARCDGINFAASGASYLFVFNNADTPQTYDGSAWAAWTGTGGPPEVSWAGSAHGRLFLGDAAAMSFWYGGAGAIAGAFTEFPLQGVARNGGGVCAMATLSGDGGDGPQDLTVFITTTGEAIVYAGTNPSSSTDWALVGRWSLPRPVGAPHRCVINYGGDALYICDAGAVPLSAFRSGADAVTVLDRAALTRNIATRWRDYTSERRAQSGWGVTPLTRLGLMVINLPWGATSAQQIVVSDGNAVSRWAGVKAAVWAEGLGGRVFFGDATASGKVFLYGEDNDDAGRGIRSEALCAFTALRSAGRTKRILRVQPVLRDANGIILTTRVLTDWSVPVATVDAAGASATSPALPPAGLGGAGVGIWGTSLFGSALFGGGEGDIKLPWRSASAIGQAVAIRLQMDSGNGRPAWLSTNMIVETGGPTA